MKKILKIGIPVFLVLAVAVGGFFVVRYRTRSLFDIVGMEKSEITKVEIQNGNTGETLTFEDKSHLTALTDALNVTCRRNGKHDRKGFDYKVTLWVGDKKQTVTIISPELLIDPSSRRFLTTSTLIDTAIFDALFSEGGTS